MGFTVGLVRNVFSRNHVGSHERKIMRRNSSENRRWISVKSYLCGNEFNSVLAEEDSASFKSSEVTVTQSIQEDLLSDKEETKSEETVENVIDKGKNSNSKSLNEEEAAIIIQSAYRSFKLRCKNEDTISSENSEEKLNLAAESPDRKSMATSVEVQTGNSTEVFSFKGEKVSIYNSFQHRNRTRAIKQKEDWDDSTLSSNVSKMRMQDRMEAATRRERALAYAFSQQLRICSKRKLAKHNNMEQNMSWSWLERWMATRLQDTSSVESHAMKQYENFNTDHHKFTIKTRFLDASGGEEKESCGSNEVPLHFDNYSVVSQEEKVSSFKSPTRKTNFKARRTVSRRKTVPSYQFHDEHPKVSMKDGSSNATLTPILPMPPTTSAARILAELRRISTCTGISSAVRPFSSAAAVSDSDPTLSSSSDSNGKASKWWLYLPGAIAFGLGSWQIVRREDKIKMLEYRGKRLQMEPLKFSGAYPSSEELDSLEFRKVVCKGVFDDKKSIYVGPRSRSISGVTENGYYVITPLMPVHDHPDSVSSPILVNRGWVPRSWKDKFLEASHDEQFADPLPSPSEADGTRSWWRFWSKEPVSSEDQVPSITPNEVVGVVRGSENPSIFVPANDPGSSQWFYIDVPSIARSCGLPENTVYVDDINENVNPSNPYPLPKDVNALIRSSVMPQDHLNYILTWYSLSAAVTFMAFKRLRQSNKRR